MKKYLVTGYTNDNMWRYVIVEAIPSRILLRAAEKGIVEPTDIQEIKNA